MKLQINSIQLIAYTLSKTTYLLCYDSSVQKVPCSMHLLAYIVCSTIVSVSSYYLPMRTHIMHQICEYAVHTYVYVIILWMHTDSGICRDVVTSRFLPQSHGT